MTTLAEQKVNRARWTGTLRGEGEKQYRQGRGCLRTKGDLFCCLGVGCDVLDPTMWLEDEAESVPYLFRFERSFPPDSVLEAFGINYQQSQLLSRANDMAGESFAKIADRIDELPYTAVA